MAKVVSLAILMWAMGSITTMTFNGMGAPVRQGVDGSGNAGRAPPCRTATQRPPGGSAIIANPVTFSRPPPPARWAGLEAGAESAI
ncbi:hypothetical protein G6F35_015806 [Rhizopus arrhizus]|uniref:Uncharacterized protein n=1 Tax=Rhizopus oryzae TaxID=64495 RepID=A0A9P7BHZ4_RHIOR|nr:hypothetical protein G6F31_016520 [Rhizopus arrhizus]KAG1059711.1 hypothetical protein G6F40_018114 [Rhizopus arrhizus]KAG1181744.1 hypothetical protein G6F35_015806 [Rhizopus arrhizus]KAG1272155.1 hypothetical protein G6F64_015545 [Rhizopus arrhizus]KAG1392752.1 hypothetical protein G6F59_014518 [Rhizopus arrhizus]